MDGRESDDDDIPQLSDAALAALRELSLLAECQTITDPDSISELKGGGLISPYDTDMDKMFPENWQMSQFWYDDATSETLAEVVGRASDSFEKKVACISCPSVFRAIGDCSESQSVHLYEYDRRFARFGEAYFFYDYNFPEEIGADYIGFYDIVIADPPFLSEECLEKVSITVKKMLKPGGKIILCTGAVLEEKAAEFLGLHRTSFIPTHQKNLGNSFACFTNFPLDLEESTSCGCDQVELTDDNTKK